MGWRIVCTACNLTGNGHYFGRNLDLNQSYGEKVCILPRHFPLAFRRMGMMADHYAMIGMGVVAEGVPLYYDAANERGLCMAGLNFPGNAWYLPEEAGRDNVSPFEFIPWILAQCATVAEARRLLDRIQLADIPFSAQIPLAPLHWILADRETAVVVESMKDGLHVHEDPVGVLTNNPPFPYQIFNLNNYRGLRTDTPINGFSQKLELDVYCQGLGALGLPGDPSSMSRFIRMAFHAGNSVCEAGEMACVSQFFHLLGSVEMPRGSCRTDSGDWDITVYSSCVNADKGLYYYTTYDNRRISCVDMHQEDLDGNTLSVYELIREQSVCWQNGGNEQR